MSQCSLLVKLKCFFTRMTDPYLRIHFVQVIHGTLSCLLMTTLADKTLRASVDHHHTLHQAHNLNARDKPDGQIKQNSPLVLVFLLLQVGLEVPALPVEQTAGGNKKDGLQIQGN